MCCLLFPLFTRTPASWRTVQHHFYERNVMSMSSQPLTVLAAQHETVKVPSDEAAM